MAIAPARGLIPDGAPLMRKTFQRIVQADLDDPESVAN